MLFDLVDSMELCHNNAAHCEFVSLQLITFETTPQKCSHLCAYNSKSYITSMVNNLNLEHFAL